MLSRSKKEVLQAPAEIADNLAWLMGVTPDFVSRWATSSTTNYMGGELDPDGSFHIRINDEGIPVNRYGEHLEGKVLSPIEDASENLDTYMCPLQPVHNVLDGGPHDTRRAAKTKGFIDSIGVLGRLDTVVEYECRRRDRRLIEATAVKLIRTLVAKIVEDPRKSDIFLPPNTPTEQQAIALEKLAPFYMGNRLTLTTRRLLEFIEQKDHLPIGDTFEWENTLRGHLALRTSDEQKQFYIEREELNRLFKQILGEEE